MRRSHALANWRVILWIALPIAFFVLIVLPTTREPRSIAELDSRTLDLGALKGCWRTKSEVADVSMTWTPDPMSDGLWRGSLTRRWLDGSATIRDFQLTRSARTWTFCEENGECYLAPPLMAWGRLQIEKSDDVPFASINAEDHTLHITLDTDPQTTVFWGERIACDQEMTTGRAQ